MRGVACALLATVCTSCGQGSEAVGNSSSDEKPEVTQLSGKLVAESEKEFFDRVWAPLKNMKLKPADRIRQSMKGCTYTCLGPLEVRAEELLDQAFKGALSRAKEREGQMARDCREAIGPCGPDPEVISKSLRASQTSWQSYRDKFCEAVSHSELGNSAAYVNAVMECRLKLEADRIDELESSFS